MAIADVVRRLDSRWGFVAASVLAIVVVAITAWNGGRRAAVLSVTAPPPTISIQDGRPAASVNSLATSRGTADLARMIAHPQVGTEVVDVGVVAAVVGPHAFWIAPLGGSSGLYAVAAREIHPNVRVLDEVRIVAMLRASGVRTPGLSELTPFEEPPLLQGPWLEITQLAPAR